MMPHKWGNLGHKRSQSPYMASDGRPPLVRFFFDLDRQPAGRQVAQALVVIRANTKETPDQLHDESSTNDVSQQWT